MDLEEMRDEAARFDLVIFSPFAALILVAIDVFLVFQDTKPPELKWILIVLISAVLLTFISSLIFRYLQRRMRTRRSSDSSSPPNEPLPTPAHQ